MKAALLLSSWLGLGGAALLACNAQVATVLASTDGGTEPTDGGEVAIDGTIVTDATFGPTLPDATPPGPDSGVVCTQDQHCNFDLTMSALAGSCFEGTCVCKFGFYVQPNGKCGKTEPPTCAQQGGTCRTNPAECEDDELEADFGTTQKCGNLHRCCIPKTQCYAPVDIVCCGAAAQYYEPNCVNGWKTCATAPMPRLRSQGCP